VLAGTCQARGSARARFRENGFVSAICGSRTEGEYGGARAGRMGFSQPNCVV
jgi:hypothetical protein